MRAGRALILGAVAAMGIAACDALPFAPAGPVGGPQVVCQGVPQEPCRQAAGTVTSAKVPARVVVRCTLSVCTPAEGDAEVTFQFVDGSSEVAGYSWATAPEPAEPQEPQEPPVPEGS